MDVRMKNAWETQPVARSIPAHQETPCGEVQNHGHSLHHTDSPTLRRQSLISPRDELSYDYPSKGVKWPPRPLESYEERESTESAPGKTDGVAMVPFMPIVLTGQNAPRGTGTAQG